MEKSYLQRNLKHNMIVNLLDGGFFGFALGFASFSTIIPLFVHDMTSSAILIGLIPAIHNVGWQLPQLLTADRVSRQRRYKPMVIFMTTQERIPFLGLALVAWLLPKIGNQTALLMTFGFLIWQGLGGGLTATGWQSMIGKIIPADRRGTFYGAQSSAANILASLGAVGAAFILERYPSPRDFLILFLLACVMMTCSWFFIAQTREPESEPVSIHENRSGFWKSLLIILQRDNNFRWFLAVRMLSQIAVAGFAFYTVYAVDELGMSDFRVGILTSVLLGAQIVANPLMGWIGDRWSHRGVMEIGVAAAALSGFIAWWAPSADWFYLVVILAGIANVAIWTIGLTMILEFGTETERPAYIGLANTLVAPITILAPLFGGWLADTAGYQLTFLVSILGGIATLVTLHSRVRDPRSLIAAVKETGQV